MHYIHQSVLLPTNYTENYYNIFLLFLVAIFREISSYFYWASLANVLNVLQPYWLIVLPLDVPDLTASLLL